MRPVLCKSAQNGIGARNRRVFSLTALLSSASCLVGRARKSSQKHVNPGENLSLAHFGGAHSSEASPGPLAPGKFFVQKFSFCAHKKSGSYAESLRILKKVTSGLVPVLCSPGIIASDLVLVLACPELAGD